MIIFVILIGTKNIFRSIFHQRLQSVSRSVYRHFYFDYKVLIAIRYKVILLEK